MTNELEALTILLTRSEQGNSDARRLLEERGARVVSLPTVEFVDPDSWEDCDRAIIHIRHYDGFLFTSRTAVERFLRRVGEVSPQAKEVITRRSVYAIGEKTETALESFGIAAVPSSDFASAEEFAALFNSQTASGKRFLFPKSNIARDVLPAALRELDAVVDEVIVYKNIPPRQKDLESARNALAHGDIDIVIFFSPSAVRNFVQMMGQQSLHGVTVAVIGPTTEAAAADAGTVAAIRATSPTTESLIEAICEYALTRKGR